MPAVKYLGPDGSEDDEIITYDQIREVNSVDVGGSKTLALSDAGTWQRCDDGVIPIVITVPTNAAVAFPTNTRIDFYRHETGTVTFSGASPPDIDSIDTLTIADQFGVVSLVKTSINVWLLFGNVV